MGCTNSTDANGRTQDKLVHRSIPEEAVAFLALVNAHHPVARYIHTEWITFAKTLEKRIKERRGKGVLTSSSIDPYNLDVGGEGDPKWATQCPEAGVTHEVVDNTGQQFLHYLRHDLTDRDWGATFGYSVAGVVAQGYITTDIAVDVGGSAGDKGEGAPCDDELLSHLRITLHYHTPPPASETS
eukprot:Tbor_TRINITY_DN2613_c0_g1::TRINITY_DN2613_c0_g1_i1::g.17916::m.17916